MSDERFEDVLESCLRMVQAGVSIDDCVARHPEHATGLLEQLAAARVLAGRTPVRPEPAAVARSRAQLLGAVAQQREAASGQEAGFPLRALRRLVVVPYALPAAAALMILGGAAFGVSAATGNPNPRDWFVASSSQAQIEIEGVLTAIDGDSLTIDTGTESIDIAITPDTEFEGADDAPATAADFAVGDVVKVHAIRGADGSLTAREVDLEGPDEPAEDVADDLDPRIRFEDGECEIRGAVSSVEPLIVNGVTIDVSSVQRTEGVLAIGAFARVEGAVMGEGIDRICVATEIKVEEENEEAEEAPTAAPEQEAEEEPRLRFEDGECEIRGIISSLAPLTVNGVTVDASSAQRIRGTLAVGASVRVKGTTIVEGSNRTCVATEIEVRDEGDEPTNDDGGIDHSGPGGDDDGHNAGEDPGSGDDHSGSESGE